MLSGVAANASSAEIRSPAALHGVSCSLKARPNSLRHVVMLLLLFCFSRLSRTAFFSHMATSIQSEIEQDEPGFHSCELPLDFADRPQQWNCCSASNSSWYSQQNLQLASLVELESILPLFLRGLDSLVLIHFAAKSSCKQHI